MADYFFSSNSVDFPNGLHAYDLIRYGNEGERYGISVYWQTQDAEGDWQDRFSTGVLIVPDDITQGETPIGIGLRISTNRFIYSYNGQTYSTFAYDRIRGVSAFAPSNPPVEITSILNTTTPVKWEYRHLS